MSHPVLVIPRYEACLPLMQESINLKAYSIARNLYTTELFFKKRKKRKKTIENVGNHKKPDGYPSPSKKLRQISSFLIMTRINH